MRTWVADLTGLAIGFALGGAALVHFWPRIETVRVPDLMAWQAPRAPEPAAMPRVQPPASQQQQQAALVPLAPEQPPDITIVVPSPAPLPEVTQPDEPDPSEPPAVAGTGSAGTGFFVADHLVMTAAHVVNACRRTQIASPLVRLTEVHVAARDTRHDIALLDTGRITAPEVLAIGQPAGSGDRVFVLGYPATAGLLVPEATWGVLENDKLPHGPAWVTNPRDMVWMEATAVTHGYSGGPIFDPGAERVVGIVRAGIIGQELRAMPGMPASGVAIGPGSALLNAFLQDQAPGTYAFPADQWGDDPITVVRRATVHVMCWH